jgi:hypothetical protein
MKMILPIKINPRNEKYCGKCDFVWENMYGGGMCCTLIGTDFPEGKLKEDDTGPIRHPKCRKLAVKVEKKKPEKKLSEAARIRALERKILRDEWKEHGK